MPPEESHTEKSCTTAVCLSLRTETGRSHPARNSEIPGVHPTLLSVRFQVLQKQYHHLSQTMGALPSPSQTAPEDLRPVPWIFLCISVLNSFCHFLSTLFVQIIVYCSRNTFDARDRIAFTSGS